MKQIPIRRERTDMTSKQTISQHDGLTLRPLRDDDRVQAERVAQRDSAALPEGALLGAFAGSDLVAAISVQGGDVVADPFRPTAEITRILALRARQLRSAAHGARRRPARMRPRWMRPALSLRRARG